MKNSATDRIRARLTNPQSPSSDLGVAPGNASSPGGAVLIDEAYLSSLLGASKTPEVERSNAVGTEFAEGQQQPVNLKQSDFTEAAELANQESSSEADLFAFHSAVTESYSQPAPEELETVEPEPVVPAPAIPVERSTPSYQPRTSAPVETRPSSPTHAAPVSRNDAPAARNKEGQRRVVKIASPTQRPAPKSGPEPESVQQFSSPPPSAPKPTQQAEPFVATRRETVAPFVSPDVSFASQDASAAGGKNKLFMIAAGAVVVLGGGGFLMFRSGPEVKTAPQAQVATRPAPPAEPEVPAIAGTQPTATPPAATATPPPTTAPKQDAKIDAAKAADVARASQQATTTTAPAIPAVAEGRAAPKQFIPPTVANRAAAVSGLVADPPPEVATNAAAGVVGLPGAVTVASVIAPPPVAPKAAEPTPAATAAPQSATPPPAAAAAKPQVATLTRIKTVSPTYPASARSARAAGPVVLSVTVGKTGKVTAIKPISGQPLLVGAAREAVSQWLYNPPTVNGQATEATIQVELNFKLP